MHEVLVGREIRSSLVTSPSRLPFAALWTHLKLAVLSLFVPAGYPDSVTEDYTAYQLHDTIQAFCSYVRSNISMQSLLQSAGVGNGTNGSRRPSGLTAAGARGASAPRTRAPRGGMAAGGFLLGVEG